MVILSTLTLSIAAIAEELLRCVPYAYRTSVGMISHKTKLYLFEISNRFV